MQLPRDGRVYARITFDQLPDGTTQVEASVDRDTWTAVPIGTDGVARYLIYGPDFTDTSQGTLVPDDCSVWVRLPDTPEVVIVRAGPVSLY